MITASLNATADREFELWHDGTTERRRPAYLCLGAGCAMQIEHADGIGSYSAFSLIWERIEGTDQYGLLDFTRETRTHWNLAVIRELLGDIDDQRLFSYLMHGVRWGVDAPRQIRISSESLLRTRFLADYSCGTDNPMCRPPAVSACVVSKRVRICPVRPREASE